MIRNCDETKLLLPAGRRLDLVRVNKHLAVVDHKQRRMPDRRDGRRDGLQALHRRRLLAPLPMVGFTPLAGSLARKFVAAPEGYYLSLHVLND